MEQDNPQERLAARAIVMRHGWNTVAYQILNPGFLLWFSQKYDAVAGYVRTHGRWIVAGAPVCAPDELPLVIEELELAAHSDRCRVCYFGAALRLYEGCKHPPRHSTVLLGAQPVWDPQEWDAMLEARASVRAQLARARNKGVIIAECCRPSEEDRDELKGVLADWLKAKPMPPMHFLVEPDTLDFLQDRRVLVARRAGVACGFLVASPIPAQNGWLVEQIIRRPDAPNGTNELLLHEAMLLLGREGSRYVTLGLVPLASYCAVEGLRNPPWIRLAFGWVRAHGRRFYNFQGLQNFKAKFSPREWEPIFVIAAEPKFGFRTLWAVAAAFSERRSVIYHGIKSLPKALWQEMRHGWRRVCRFWHFYC